MTAALARAVSLAFAPAWSLRDRVDEDLDFLAALYAETREDELRPVNWPPQQKAAFLHDQFRLQHAHYLEHYPGAHWWVLLKGGEPAGRLYVHQTTRELRVMDIALLSTHRGAGVGTSIMRALLAHADAAAIEASLHVEPFNRVLRLYQRLGFETVETRGAYLFMRRPAGGPLQLKTIS